MNRVEIFISKFFPSRIFFDVQNNYAIFVFNHFIVITNQLI
jgi:hypothetical protein